MWRPLTVTEWLSRKKADIDQVKDPVLEIIEMVRNQGDGALFQLSRRFDGVEPEYLRIPDEKFEEAYEYVEPALVRSLEKASERIYRFHKLQLSRNIWMKEVEPGITLGMKFSPLRRVGAYVPGGRAAYPSTALMAVIPARVAGVREICCCTPPPVSPVTLVALDIAGVREVYGIGGAHAIAAMALGTESIPRVQKIVGPGNLFVTAAKMILREYVEIDFPAGPSEIVVLADHTARPEFIAADILAQAEHDPRASCALITTDPDLPREVWFELERQLMNAERKELIVQALENSGYMVVTSLEEAIDTVNALSPEHLSVQIENPDESVDRISDAGAIFIGPYSAVACGDYASGTNHILPTAGHASVYSGLDVFHFLKRSTIQSISREGLEAIGDVVETLARAEGLYQHARSVSLRRRGIMDDE